MTGQMDPQTMMLLQMLQHSQSPQYTAAPVGGGGPGQIAQSPGASPMAAAGSAAQNMMLMMALKKLLEKKGQIPQTPQAQAPAAAPTAEAPSSFSPSELAAG